MYLTVKQQVKQLSKEHYRNLRELCHFGKNLINQAIYNARQHYFAHGKYLKYEENYKLLKNSENYRANAANMSQQLLREVDGMFKSFFGLLKLAKMGRYSLNDVQLPKYLPKDGFATLVISEFSIKNGFLTLPYSRSFNQSHTKITFKIPPILIDKNIKEIRIIPKAQARFFEVQYTYEVEENQKIHTNNKALAIDFGINNLATCVSSTGRSFIVDGRRLKSINQWYNKENARLQSIKDLQGFGKKRTNKQQTNLRIRNNKVNDYLSKTARFIVNYCIEQQIGFLVCGYNDNFQRSTNIGKRNNQNFLQIPYGKLLRKLEYLCKLYGIAFLKQEESYTSKASFFDEDIIPTYCINNPQEFFFTGKRIKRGLYLYSKGYINADVNAALNILRKSNVVALDGLYGRGDVDTPVRIKIA